MRSEPYRLFFPLGTLFLIIGALVWVPLLWTGDHYPVTLHRYLMLNGFAGCFIGGFLMTAVPRFSETEHAKMTEIIPYLMITILGMYFAYTESIRYVFIFSLLQPVLIFRFLLPRMLKRKKNPPPTFVFIFLGLILWIVSGILCIVVDEDAFKSLHYEGAIACIILGVGSRLIPAITGHQEILETDKKSLPFIVLLLLVFAGSYFVNESYGNMMRSVSVFCMAMFFWKIYKLPKVKTALTWGTWCSAVLILVSFFLKTFWPDGMIHASHSFFINGIVLLSLLIGTRVIVSHGPKVSDLEKSKVLYVVTFLLVFAAATRVSAFLMPEHYLSHLAYSSILLVLAALTWAWKYLKPSYLLK